MNGIDFKNLTKRHPEALALMKSLRELGKYRYRPEPESGINMSEFQVLHVLWHSEKDGNGSLTATELAGFLKIAVPTLTPLLKALEAKKLLRREKDPDDGRISRILLTEKGMKFQKQELMKGVEKFQMLVDHLGEFDTRRFIEILEKATQFFRENSVKEGRSCCCGGRRSEKESNDDSTV